MHEKSDIGQSHFFAIYRPCPVCADDLSVMWVGIGCPVLSVDEVCPLESSSLVIFHMGIAYELRVELIPFGMGDDKFVIGLVNPFGKRIRYGLR